MYTMTKNRPFLPDNSFLYRYEILAHHLSDKTLTIKYRKMIKIFGLIFNQKKYETIYTRL